MIKRLTGKFMQFDRSLFGYLPLFECFNENENLNRIKNYKMYSFLEIQKFSSKRC